jgi:TatD DNase family protein
LILDSHAHLSDFPDTKLSTIFHQNVQLVVLSNSVDLNTSTRNLDLSQKFRSAIIPFVGIHPEIFARPTNQPLNRSLIDSVTEKVGLLARDASGIGEIGLDPKYGNPELQNYLFEKMLQLAESTSLPVALHCRDSVSELLEKISSYNLRGTILFHWFAGSEDELSQITERGMYSSFSPSILFSKKLSRLLERANPDLILPETDAPTPFRSFGQNEGSPFLIASVVFKMASVLKISFESMRERLLQNSNGYLRTQTSLRVKEN